MIYVLCKLCRLRVGGHLLHGDAYAYTYTYTLSLSSSSCACVRVRFCVGERLSVCCTSRLYRGCESCAT